MKNLTLIFSIFLILTACNDDDQNNGTYGTIIKSITESNGGYSSVNNYFYDNTGKLSTIENISNVNSTQYFNYLNGKLDYATKILYDGRFHSKDTVIYDYEGRILQLVHTFGPNQERPVITIYSFEYDNSNNLISRTIFMDNLFFDKESYIWENNHIKTVKRLNTDDEVTVEWENVFDDKNNFRLSNPLTLIHPVHLGNNNLIDKILTYNNGSNDLDCEYCTDTYTYNLDDFPTKIVTAMGRTFEIVYE